RLPAGAALQPVLRRSRQLGGGHDAAVGAIPGASTAVHPAGAAVDAAARGGHRGVISFGPLIPAVVDALSSRLWFHAKPQAAHLLSARRKAKSHPVSAGGMC